MAGRPRKRAKEEAQAAALRSLASGASAPLADPLSMEPPPDRPPLYIDDDGNVVAPALPAFAPLSDRDALSQWWRDQVAAIEVAADQRRAELAEAVVDGEVSHPSPVFGRQVKIFGALGIPRDVVAVLLGITEADLVGYYGGEYQVGSAEVVAQVATNLLRIATSTNDRVAVKAAIEVMNRRGGEEWRAPAQKLEIDDSRKAKAGVIDSRQLSWEDRQTMKEILNRTLGRTVDAVPAGVAGAIESDAEVSDGE